MRQDQSSEPRDLCISHFLARNGWEDGIRHPLAGDASFRRYERVRCPDGRQAVLMDAPPPKERVGPFISIADILVAAGFSAPRILAADEERGLLLLEDLGDTTYARALKEGADEAELYHLAVDCLIALHKALPASICAGLPDFDPARMMREVSLILDWFWPAIKGSPPAPEIRESFQRAWTRALSEIADFPRTLVLFDFHIDNLLYLQDRPGVTACGLLDFQDAVYGPQIFDLMSLIDDARRDVPEMLAASLIARYQAAFPHFSRDVFQTGYAVMGAQRHTRILGTFTRLYHRDGKPAYQIFMPRVWRQLTAALAHPVMAPVANWFATHLPPAEMAGRALPPASPKLERVEMR